MREEQAREGENASDTLKEVRLALARIDAGTFGLCENGGEHIDEKRLEAIPWTRYCSAHEAEAATGQARGASRCDETPRRSPPRPRRNLAGIALVTRGQRAPRCLPPASAPSAVARDTRRVTRPIHPPESGCQSVPVPASVSTGRSTSPTLPTNAWQPGIPPIRRKRRVTGNAQQKRIRGRAR